VTHLGDRLAAFVDAELPHDARDRVLAHLTVCAECRAAADAERLVKAALAAIQGPRPSEDLTRRLLALAEPGEPMPPRRRLVDSSVRQPTVPVGDWTRGGRPVAGRPASRSPGGSAAGVRRRHPRLQFVAAAGIGVAVALGAAVVLGGREQPGPALGPGNDWFAVQHAATTGGLPLVDPAMSMTVGFTDPGTLAPGGPASAAPVTGAYFGGVSPR
jgi:anti-sigma factor RsiW